MEKYHGNTVGYWKRNAEENYLTTPISVLKYITVLEEQAEQLHKTNVSSELNCDHEWLNHSFDHFGFLQEQICDKCGAKQSVP